MKLLEKISVGVLPKVGSRIKAMKTYQIIESNIYFQATEIFWPLFVNGSESLDIRVSALYILIVTQPTASRLLTFFWNMQTESNYHVYNFFFTTIHSFANTKHPCFYEM